MNTNRRIQEGVKHLDTCHEGLQVARNLLARLASQVQNVATDIVG